MYPSAKVRLAIRFEEFDRTLVDRAPKKVAKQLKGTKAPRNGGDLTVATSTAEGGGTLYLLKGPNTSQDPKSARPTAPAANILAKTQVVQAIVPVSADLTRNNIHTADQLSLTLRWDDFPLDPRCIRSVAVDYYLGCLTPQEFAMGQSGMLRPNGEPYSLIPDEYLNPLDGKMHSNLRFQGWVDKDKVSLSTSGSEVTFDCTDNTRLVLDQIAPPNLRIDPKLPIEKAIAEYLTHFPQFEGYTVRYLPVENEGKITVEAATKRGAWAAGMGPPPSDGDLSVLDYLIQTTMMLGHHVRVRGAQIVVQPATTVWGGKQAPRLDDCYVPRVIEGIPFPRRTFILGKNIDPLEFERDFSGRAAKNFEIRSYDPARKGMIVGRYPQKKDKVISALPGGKEDDKWMVQTVRAGLSQETVNSIAKQAYEQLARAELGVNVITQDMYAYGGSPANPDLLALESGDAIDILQNIQEATSTNADIAASQRAADVGAAYLRRLGYDEDFAKAYADSRVHIGMPRTFYTREAKISWKTESGVSIAVNACNFIEVRLDPEVQ